MRLSQSLFITTREAPAGAELRSHQLLLRAGFVRRVGPGLYASLPLMQRVLHKVERLVRAEMDALGAQEVSLPQLQPAELWQQSGRWNAYTRAEGIMFSLRDRAGRDLALGPTHEEVAAAVMGEVLRSHKQLPVTLYQIGRKFRDELRPRGLMLRAREFVMKDAYSFHADQGGLDATFEAMSGAYGRVLDRLGLPWRMVEADSGAIGGARSREFAVLAGAGEDEILFSPDGRYAANAEKAVGRLEDGAPSPFQRFERRHTPGTAGVTSLCAALECQASQSVKNALYDAQLVLSDGSDLLAPVLVSLRGDAEVNPTKLAGALAEAFPDSTLLSLEVARPERWAAGPLPLGYLGPDLPDDLIASRDGVWPRFVRLLDASAADLSDFVTGANEADWHVVGANWGEQYAWPRVVDVRQARAGERSPHDPAQRLASARGIEVGHVFQLGDRYARALGASYTDADGTQRFPLMGCYGLGLTRLAQAAAEVLSDDRGLVWPAAIAPYTVILTPTNMADAAQREAGEHLYAGLRAAGLDAALDDRDERAGVKFADADLIGAPWRLTLGRGLRQGLVELRERRTGQAQEVEVAGVIGHLSSRLMT